MVEVRKGIICGMVEVREGDYMWHGRSKARVPTLEILDISVF